MANLNLSVANTHMMAAQILEADQSIWSHRSDYLGSYFDKDQRTVRVNNMKYKHRRAEARLKKHGSETSSGADLTYAMDRSAEEPWRRDP
jgi:hypothetical protein